MSSQNGILTSSPVVIGVLKEEHPLAESIQHGMVIKVPLPNCIDSIDKKLAALLSVGGHLVDPSGLSLSLKPNKSVDEGPGFPVTMITVQNDSCKRAKKMAAKQ